MSQIRVEVESRNSTDESRKPLLSAKNLKVTYVKEKGLFLKRKFLIRALDDVSFDIFHSESVAIVGETGSGKTTLARCIMGLVRPQSGRMFVDGKDSTRLRGRALREHRRRVQIVYQDPYESLNPDETVYQTISTPIRLLAGVKDHTKVAERISQALVDVGLNPSEVLDRYPHQLSGGQRQRVNIARALAPEPELLIADEPITMLDAEQRLNILALLKSLKQKRNLTVLMITHDLASARLVSNRIMIMYLGKIVESGPTKEVVSKPRHPYVELILESAPRKKSSELWSSQTHLDNVAPMDENLYPSKGCVFAPRCKYATNECLEVQPELSEERAGRSFACYHPLNISTGIKSPD
jgi:oligopeptide/dipeptide ABC transporter ATP-binding protein